MGAFTVALGLPRLVLLPPEFRLPGVSTRIDSRRISYSHSFGKSSIRRHSFSWRIVQPSSCSASVSWPYEEQQSESPTSPGDLEQESGGVEALAVAVGVVVSAAVAFAKLGSGGGAGVGILSLAILGATTVALRQQLAAVMRMLVAQFNFVQAALAGQLSTVRENFIVWGSSIGASVSSSAVPVESAPFAGLREDRLEEVAGTKELSSAEIEAALSHIAKSVAQLTMVVANLDDRIASLEKDTSTIVSSFKSTTPQSNKIVEGDVTLISSFTDVEERLRGTYRIRNSSDSGTQLKWEEAFVKNSHGNEVKPQGSEHPEDSRTSTNRVDVFSTTEYNSKALPSTVLYDSRGDRVLLLDTRPVDVAFEVGSIRENQSQSGRSKFTKAETGVSRTGVFPLDVEIRRPLQGEDFVPETNKDQIQSKQETAAVEFIIQDARYRSPEADGGCVLQSNQRSVELPAARIPSAGNTAWDGAQDNDIFRKETDSRKGKMNDEADALGEETSRVSWEAVRRSNEKKELDGSEGYRVVPATRGIAFKPDARRLKSIMSGKEPSAASGAEATQPNAWNIQHETNTPEMGPSKVFYKEKYAGSESVGNEDSGSEEFGRDRVGVDRGAARPEGVQDVLSCDGQERSPRVGPRVEGTIEGTKSSGRADYGQRWGREGSSDASDAEVGGNGSSNDTIQGGNGSKRNRQGSSASSGAWNASDGEVEPPRNSQEGGPSRGGRPPSYPSEQTDTYRNLPEPQPDDIGFQKILDEVEALLKEGREGLEGRIEVGVAESMLCEAAELCEKAVGVRPSSLVAVGLWGNTLLLHGELKLRLSQNLRSMLPEPPSKSLNRQALKEAEEEKLSLETTLQEVGEECEQLLVESGRKYRLALSMDRNDMRALYNWGLALCYRGQLIAEEGGETAAQDADKVFLAAIDKFEAMIGLSDSYAAGALLNWGLAMRDRSRLRPLGSPERQKILGQAKEIFQEALRVDPNYGQARGAVAACVVELKRLQEYEQDPKKPSNEPSTSRGFRDWWG